MKGTCYTPVMVCAIRATELTAGGAPKVGSESIFVTDKAVNLGVSMNVTEGQRLNRVSGCGVPIVDFTDCDRVTGVDLSMASGVFDFAMLSLLTSGTLYDDGQDNAIGYSLPSISADCPIGVGVEAWVRALDLDTQAVNETSGLPAYFRFIFPKVTWSFDGQLMFNGTDVTDTNLRGRGSSNPQWGTGPAGDIPMMDPGSAMHVYWDDESGLPDAMCEFQELVAS